VDKDEIIRMAREAASPFSVESELEIPWRRESFLPRFAALVAAHEREACAKVCDEYDVFGFGTRDKFAAAIRARGEK